MRWVRRIWHRNSTERQLDRELRFHLEEEVARYVQSGFSPEEARRRAALQFGGIERFKEECREVRSENKVRAFFYDLHHAWRSLKRDLRFSLLAVLALALGIGCSTIIFSLVYNGVLHPFPYQGSERLVALWVQDSSRALTDKGSHRVVFTLAEIRAFREGNQSLEDIVGWGNWYVRYSKPEGTESFHGCRLTRNAFEFFGVLPLFGRLPTPADVQPGAPRVVALSYKLWQRLYHGDRGAVGKEMILDGEPFTVVAIMPPRFTPDGADLWSLVTPEQEARDPYKDRMDDNEPSVYFATGRLKPGFTPAAAGADLDLIAHRLAAKDPRGYPKSFAMQPQLLNEAIVDDLKPVIYFLCGAVAMLLLISCGNVANLLLARATAREREIALRASIGATRGRLVRQLLTEALVLAGAGCVAGCVLAWSGLHLVLLPERIPAEADVSLNATVLLFALLASLASVFICGLSPALHAIRGNYAGKLAAVGMAPASLHQSRIRSALIVGEVALSATLLVFAGLAIRSFRALTHVQFGFDPSRVLSASLNFPKGRYSTVAEKKAYFDRVLTDIAQLPEVTAVATSVMVPLKHSWGSWLTLAGEAKPISSGEDSRPGAMLDLCSEGIFRVYDVQLVEGRLLSAEDVGSARRVAVVNEAFLRKIFGGQDPLRRRFKLDTFEHFHEDGGDPYFEVVGVVTDVRNQGLEGPPFPQVYVPYTASGIGNRDLMIRTTINPLSLLETIRKRVWVVDRSVSIVDPEGMNSILSRVYFAAPQFGVFAISAFAGVGLLLVVIGVFGLMAYTVGLQNHEIGLRIALGAHRRTILKMVLGRGMRLTTAGVVIGSLVALGVAHALRGRFFALSPADPLTYLVVCALLTAVSLLACWVPARRATRIEPMATLRYE
jgi:putative ABC transport system permease protein